MTTLSLAMIVRNEEAVLGRVLGAASTFCDQLVVVDTGSTDRTVDIARQYGAEVHHFEWVDDFAAARNYSFSKCTGDWILWLDADDVLPESTIEIGKRLKAEILPTTPAGVIMATYNYDWAPDGTLQTALNRERFIRRSLNLKWDGRIHEAISVSNVPVMISQQFIVEHRPTAVHGERKVGRNLSYFEKYVDPDTASLHELNLYGSELHAAGQHVRAIEMFKRYLDKYPNDMRDQFDERYINLIRLTEAYRQTGQRVAACKAALQAVEWDPRRAEAYGLLAMTYLDVGQPAAARAMAAAGLACKPPTHGGLSFMAFYGPHMRAIYDLACQCVENPDGLVAK